jgi:hypothetical protein
LQAYGEIRLNKETLSGWKAQYGSHPF